MAANPQNRPGRNAIRLRPARQRPDPQNMRFYPSQSTNVLTVNDPALGQTNVPIYNFNTANPDDATPARKRHRLPDAQRALADPDTGADGFRLDATKNMPNWVLNYLDHAVYKAIQAPLLDGSTPARLVLRRELRHELSPRSQSRVRLDINSQPANTGRREPRHARFSALLRDAVESLGNGLANDWRNVVNSSFDVNDDGFANLNNGSQGVAVRPEPRRLGLAAVPVQRRLRVHAAASGQRDRLLQRERVRHARQQSSRSRGRGDALGGFYGNGITTLVDIRNSHGRGNYLERWIDKETLVYERDNSVIAGYNNRLDNGYDQRTVNTNFAPGTHLVELTGNATDATVDPNNDIFDVGHGRPPTARSRFASRGTRTPNGTEHDKGYVMYGPATPRGTISVSNVARTLPAQTPTANTNGTARLTPIDVVKTNSFDVRLATIPVILPDSFHDLDADGDNALLALRRRLGSERQRPRRSRHARPRRLTASRNSRPSAARCSAAGTGNTSRPSTRSQLSEGYHYITARAYRHRASGPAILPGLQEGRLRRPLPPAGAIDSLQTISGSPNDRDVIVRSTDKTATAVSVFYNIGASQFTLDQLANMGETSQTPPARTTATCSSGACRIGRTATIRHGRDLRVTYDPDAGLRGRRG
jgi:hypothetical protein